MRIISIIVLLLGMGHLCYAETLRVALPTGYLTSAPYASPILEIPVNYPLFVVRGMDEFVEVTDFENRRGWIDRRSVGNEPAVVIQSDRANVRMGPGLKHKLLFKAIRGVAFQVLETKGEWIHIKHESGKQGWVHKKLVWGI